MITTNSEFGEKGSFKTHFLSKTKLTKLFIPKHAFKANSYIKTNLKNNLFSNQVLKMVLLVEY